MPDIGDFIRRLRRSVKIAIATLGTPGDFRRSRRSAYKIAKCVAALSPSLYIRAQDLVLVTKNLKKKNVFYS